MTQLIIDADSHITEPADVWTSRVPAKFRDDVPIVVRDGPADLWVLNGERLSPAARRVTELLSLGIAIAAVGYLAWWACRFTFESWQMHEVAQGLLVIPMWIPQMSFAVGSLLLLLAVVDEFCIVLAGGLPTYERLVAERHAAGDFSSDL